MDSCSKEQLDCPPPSSSLSAGATPSPSPVNPWPQISDEHCYPKLMAQWTNLEHPLPIQHIFHEARTIIPPAENGYLDQSAGEESPDEGDDSIIDVEHVTMPTSLPYSERKVLNVMYECSHHMNLVRLPLENPEGLLEKSILESSYQQQVLMKKVLEALQSEHLARLAFVGILEQPIQRRLSCDKTARKFRKILGDIKWDPKLTHWLHKTFLRALDNTYLPVYLDILQVLKSQCPTLVETMIHGSNPGEVSNEAVSLLLKRPWSILVGMAPMDKRVTFELAPVFVTIPYSSSPLGGRRWRLFQNQLSSIGKVVPVVPSDYIRETGREFSHRESVEELFHCAMIRLHELKEQYVARPIVLISWSVGCRVACKIAEVENIACLINLGLTTRGMDHEWKISSDPFSTCTTPSIFVMGDRGLTSSWKYAQELRSTIKARTSLVLVHGADDLLRLPFSLKRELNITQPMLDRLIQDRIYEFLVYILPCSLPVEVRQIRKRKVSSDDQSSQLSCAIPNSPIVLTSHSSPIEDTLSPMLRGLLANGKVGLQQINSSSGLRQFSSMTDFPTSKLPKIGRPPKSSRPRSKSTTASLEQKLKNKDVVRNRSLSGDAAAALLGTASSPNSNCSNNNSTEASPNTLLSIATFQSQIPALLPITPPNNPFENPNQISDPKIRKQLNL